jgi:SAM-dependent methyltransferase
VNQVTPSNENRPYGLLARFYDELLPSGMSEVNRHARGVMLGSRLEDIGSVCDLACGSGGTALDLARTGRRVYAVDNSAEFCRIVRSRTRQEGLRVKVLRADMRDFHLPEQVDLITCEFAALNNLANHRDIAKVFQAVFRALRPGGYFLFDVNTLLAQKEQCPETQWTESPRFILVMRGTLLDPKGRQVRLDFEWFLPEGKLWRHRRETVFNIGWTDREIRQALRTAGFEKLLTRDGMDVRPPIPGAKRGYDAYYLTRKPGR